MKDYVPLDPHKIDREVPAPDPQTEEGKQYWRERLNREKRLKYDWYNDV